MSTPKIGLATYTIRDKLKTPADYARCLKKVKEIGYEGVEGSAIDPLIDVKEYARILQGEGLTCICNHAGEPDLRGKLDTVVGNAKSLGCGALGFPWLDQKYWNEQGIRSLAPFLNETGAKLRKEGIQFLYHNHHVEFNRVGKKTLLQLIYELTDAQNVWAELDTYWVQHGGGDPALWIDKLHDRIILLHLKDMTVRAAKQEFAEIGEGNLNWPAILRSARAAGVRWYIVEQDTCPGDPFDSLAISLKNLKAMGLK